MECAQPAVQFRGAGQRLAAGRGESHWQTNEDAQCPHIDGLVLAPLCAWQDPALSEHARQIFDLLLKLAPVLHPVRCRTLSLPPDPAQERKPASSGDSAGSANWASSGFRGVDAQCGLEAAAEPGHGS